MAVLRKIKFYKIISHSLLFANIILLPCSPGDSVNMLIATFQHVSMLHTADEGAVKSLETLTL